MDKVTEKERRRVSRLVPGPVVHSRWLTFGIRILRLYLSTKAAGRDPNLDILSVFVLKVYARCWFTIKRNPRLANGTPNFFEIVKSSRYLPPTLRKVVDKVLKTNFYFAHSESLILAMLADESHKKQAIELIGKIRNKKKRSNQIRRFTLPNINFEAITSESTDFSQLLTLSDVSKLSEPPLTRGLSLEELEQYEVPTFPCHSQATERCVRLVSEASQKVIGQAKRHGTIINTLYSRAANPDFRSKRDYSTPTL
jgi:hypothetical protein